MNLRELLSKDHLDDDDILDKEYTINEEEKKPLSVGDQVGDTLQDEIELEETEVLNVQITQLWLWLIEVTKELTTSIWLN